ncbi:hypothetical protein [Paenibacillus sp. J2TS4]|uniref:hypothetical protein n=1 Tax=Paenibacillus sp. J2TS4 TaxID=2807194 RepID=UPI001B1FEB56|nr:hypothetical protein [Paenibacillus sp. J2TS4]GIP35487.1 hypothetical protein J2TS4_46970 [Paenibacillus sp. J2TS4]
MSKVEVPAVNQEDLVKAWQDTLPTLLNEGDRSTVVGDAINGQALRIEIATAGRTGYVFDFQCTYVDSREVKVDLIDVEIDNRTIDERNETIQQLVDDYVRHIHECAQALHEMTNR